jgi:uncharacterized protein with HEPN domain
LEVVGEAAKRVPDTVRAEMPSAPWKAIAGFRDFVAHVYFALDDSIVWRAVNEEIPVLLAVVEAYLSGSADEAN